MVSYKRMGQNAEIPVKVTRRNGKDLIEYIIPNTIGNRYGDEYIKKNVNQDDAAFGVRMLKSFYSRYITNILTNRDKKNKALRSEYISSEVQEWLPAFMECQGFDPIINAQDVNETTLNSLKVEQLEKTGWYMVSYSWNGKDKTSIVIKLEKNSNRLMMSYIIPLRKK